MVIVLKKTDSKREIKRKLRPSEAERSKKLFNAKKFNGILKLKIDPVKIQRKLRED